MQTIDIAPPSADLKTDEIATALIYATPVNPALARLKNKLVQNRGNEVTISRYDRMHHRHNRS